MHAAPIEDRSHQTINWAARYLLSFEPDGGLARLTTGGTGHADKQEEHLMTHVFEASHDSPTHHRPTKFTPENIRQIVNLVDRGKSAPEIAEIIGVTPGTLKSTCSKLRISLRRPRFDLGTGLVLQRRPRTSSKARSTNPRTENRDRERADNSAEEPTPKFERQPADQEPTVVPQEQLRSSQQTSATFAVLIRYKGEERMTELPLSHRMIAQLAIEAEFRNTTITELVATLIAEIAMNDKFSLVFEPQVDRYRS